MVGIFRPESSSETTLVYHVIAEAQRRGGICAFVDAEHAMDSTYAKRITNQLREKIGVMFGSPKTTSGGRALKFYASVRLDIRRIETLKDGAEAFGNRVRVKVVKNKVAPPFKQAEFDVIYGQGISWEGSVITESLVRGTVVRDAFIHADPPDTVYSEFPKKPVLQGFSNAMGTFVASDSAAFLSHLHQSDARYEVIETVALRSKRKRRGSRTGWHGSTKLSEIEQVATASARRRTRLSSGSECA